MQLGDFEIYTVSGGRFRADGGTMFGVVPKVLWSRLIEVDEKNCIPQATHCVLVKSSDRTLLIDTGYGAKLSEKERSRFSAEPGDPLARSLEERGVTKDDVDVVILSHLHFDHAGGATRKTDDGALVPAFPNAQYIVQRKEWEVAAAQTPELRPAYPADNFLPLVDSGQLRFVEGDVEIVPGIRAVVTGGHTEGHMMLVIESGGESAVYMCDICPTWRHLPSLWCMSYDVDLLQTRRIKPRILGEIADKGWLALSDHDPDHAAARLRRDKRRDFAVAEAVEDLA